MTESSHFPGPTLCLEHVGHDVARPKFILIFPDAVVALHAGDSHPEQEFTDVGAMLAATELSLTDLASTYVPVALEQVKLPRYFVTLVDESGTQTPLVSEPERSIRRAVALLQDVRARVPDDVIRERGELVIAVVN